MVAISFRTNNCVSRDNVECMERTLCCHGLCTVHAGRQGIAFGLASFAAGLLELPRRGGGSIVELPAKYAAAAGVLDGRVSLSLYRIYLPDICNVPTTQKLRADLSQHWPGPK